MTTHKARFSRRKNRVRSRIGDLARRGKGRARLSIARSDKHIYAQVIDDANGKTLAAASTVEKPVKEGLKSTANVEAAKKVGALVAERAKKAGVTEVVFDRGGYMYHGRVKALAEGAREGGLSF